MSPIIFCEVRNAGCPRLGNKTHLVNMYILQRIFVLDEIGIQASISFPAPCSLAYRYVIYFDSEWALLALCHHDSKVLDVSAIKGNFGFFQISSIGEVELLEWNNDITPLANLCFGWDRDEALIKIVLPGPQGLDLTQKQPSVLQQRSILVNFPIEIQTSNSSNSPDTNRFHPEQDCVHLLR